MTRFMVRKSRNRMVPNSGLWSIFRVTNHPDPGDAEFVTYELSWRAAFDFATYCAHRESE